MGKQNKTNNNKTKRTTLKLKNIISNYMYTGWKF